MNLQKHPHLKIISWCPLDLQICRQFLIILPLVDIVQSLECRYTIVVVTWILDLHCLDRCIGNFDFHRSSWYGDRPIHSCGWAPVLVVSRHMPNKKENIFSVWFWWITGWICLLQIVQSLRDQLKLSYMWCCCGITAFRWESPSTLFSYPFL